MAKLKKTIFMLKKLWGDLNKPSKSYKLADDVSSNVLGYYYFLFKEDRISQGKDQPLIKKFDENGIPVNKTYIDVSDKDYVYFPISIGQMGLSVFHTFLETGSDRDKQRFMKFVNWFYEHAEISDEFGARWMTDVALPQYKNEGPWASAFSQARGINILLRGYQLTKDKKYAELAEKALKPFTISSDQGGVTSFTEWGPFYEEYTSTVPTMVLNGMIFSLCGLRDFVRVFPENELAKKLFDEGIQTLIHVLPKYDLGFWSRYNLCKAEWHPEVDPSTINYQRLHVTQLNLLYGITGNKLFKDYADKFQDQDRFVNMIRMYFLKYRSLKKMGRL